MGNQITSEMNIHDLWRRESSHSMVSPPLCSVSSPRNEWNGGY